MSRLSGLRFYRGWPEGYELILAMCGGQLFQKEGLASVKTIQVNPLELPLLKLASGKLLF